MTPKQKRFCDEYLTDLNATQAAVRAGYSKRTAYAIGDENLRKPEIREYIEKRLAEKEEALIARQDEVLKTLTRIMRREEQETTVVTCKTHKTFYDDNGKKVTSDTETPISVSIPAKLMDVNKAAELLGKYYAMFTDRTKIDGAAPVQIVEDLPEDG